MKIDLNHKKFKALSNSDNGEVSSDTIFEYGQDGSLIWANYHGGDIKKGHLAGKIIAPDQLQFVYHHVNKNDEILTGQCLSMVSTDGCGRIVLKEKWQWTCGDHSEGESELIEIMDEQ